MSMDDYNAWTRTKACRLCGAKAGNPCTYPSGRLIPSGHGIRQIEVGCQPRNRSRRALAEYETAIQRMWRGRRRERMSGGPGKETP